MWALAAMAGGQLLGSAANYFGAKYAADAQLKAANKGIAEQRRQFDELQKILAPYQQAGIGALQGQQALLGLSGADAQKQAIDALAQSEQFKAMSEQGERAILANASATGGLRGGNTQAMLAQFRPQMLQQMIEQQYSRLGGLTSIGQNAAAGVGNAGMGTGQNISNLYGQIGAAQAGQYLAQANAIGQASGLTGSLIGAKMAGIF